MVVADVDGQLVVEQAGARLPAVPRFLPATGTLVASMAKRGIRGPFAPMNVRTVRAP